MTTCTCTKEVTCPAEHAIYLDRLRHPDLLALREQHKGEQMGAARCYTPDVTPTREVAP